MGEKRNEIAFFSILILIGLIINVRFTGFVVNNSDLQLGNTTYVFVIALLVLLLALSILLMIKHRPKARRRDGRVNGLIGRKVYSELGDFVGVVKDVLLGKNRIYGLKVKGKKKILIKSKAIKKYGQIIIVSSEVRGKLEEKKNE